LGKNDVRMAIEQFYTPKKLIPPKQISGYAPVVIVGISGVIMGQFKNFKEIQDVDHC